MENNREQEAVKETAVAPAETEAVNEAPVTTENEAPVENAEVAETEPKKKSSKLFNLLCLCISLFLLVADVLLLIAMNTGIIKVGDMSFTAVGLINYLQRTLAIGFGDIDVGRIGGLLTVVVFCIVYIVFYINILIGVIKSIIKIFSFFKLGRAKEETEVAFSQFAKTVNKNFGLGVIFVALSLMTTDSLTGMGITVITFATIIYVGLAVFKQLFITPAEGGESLFARIVTLVTELGRRAVMLAVAFLLAANITACIPAFFENIMPTIDKISVLSDSSSKVNATELTGMMYCDFIRQYLLIIPFAIIVSIVGKIAKWYVFNNGKKDVNGGLFRDFVGLFIVSLLLLVADCVMLNMAGYGGVGSAITDWMGILLASVAGAVIAFVSRDKSVVVAR